MKIKLMVDALPCPFCGSDYVHLAYGQSGRFCYVECVDCDARGPKAVAAKHEAQDTAAALAMWNERGSDGEE